MMSCRFYILRKTLKTSDVAVSIALPLCHFPSTKDLTLVVNADNPTSQNNDSQGSRYLPKHFSIPTISS